MTNTAYSASGGTRDRSTTRGPPGRSASAPLVLPDPRVPGERVDEVALEAPVEGVVRPVEALVAGGLQHLGDAGEAGRQFDALLRTGDAGEAGRLLREVRGALLRQHDPQQFQAPVGVLRLGR